MKKRCLLAWFLLFLSLPLMVWIGSGSPAGAADPLENPFPHFGLLNEPFQGRVTGPSILLLSPSAADPVAVGCLALGVKPWLNLIDKASYSLKLSLPLTWGPSFERWYDNGGSILGGGFFASVQLKSLPPRFGSWTLSTGLFYIRKDPVSQEQVVFATDLENGGGIGAINISIVY